MADTIYALASARGKAGVAVVRLSGPLSWEAVAVLAGRLPAPRQVALRRLTRGGEVLDEALVLIFAAGASFTGEESAELHLHGGPAVVSSVLRALADRPGLRPAGPGEFTRRAMLNGRLDLAQVEGLADLIDAETEAQRRQAVRTMSGAVGARAAGWRADLLQALALVEAGIDFADEDVPVDVWPEVRAVIGRLDADLTREAAGSVVAERLRDGFEVAILGAPNAGKSTLLNRIAGRDVAITSPVPGTTRDVLEVRLDLGGLPVTLLDTAGLRETADVVEGIGVARARARASEADLRVILTGPEGAPEGIVPTVEDIVLRGRVDEAEPGAEGVSGLTGAGVDALLARIESVLARRSLTAGVLTHDRHRRAVTGALAALTAAREGAEAGMPQAEIVAEDLRTARRKLESLIGTVDTEAVLGEIFGRFCIGK